MAADDSQNDSPKADDSKTGRQPLSQAQRKRFQQLFAHANKQAATHSYDYATELYSQCVLGDINNSTYWQHFFSNLRKKYNNNRHGAKLASIRTGTQRATIKKCQLRKDWEGVFRHGLEVLKVNPWDASALMAMAAAGEAIKLDEVPLIFFHMALEAAPKDVELNRAAAKALRARRQHDQAIACWRRVLDSKKEDEEAKKTIGELETERVIHKGGYEDADSSRDVQNENSSLSNEEPSQKPSTPAAQLTPEQKLQQAVRANPSEVEPYLELAEFYCQKDDYLRAIKVFAKAYQISEKDPDVLGRLLDAEMRGLRKRLRELEKEHQASGSDETKQQWQQVRKLFDQKSLDRSKHLAERYPNELGYQFDLGVAYQKMGQHKEAIEYYQKSRNDPRRKGECLLHLGQCFSEINQLRLASTNYDAALDEISGQNTELLKEALYSAGKLSMEMNNLEKAEQRLTELAGLDFGYKDVAALLDKVNELRDTE